MRLTLWHLIIACSLCLYSWEIVGFYYFFYLLQVDNFTYSIFKLAITKRNENTIVRKNWVKGGGRKGKDVGLLVRRGEEGRCCYSSKSVSWNMWNIIHFTLENKINKVKVIHETILKNRPSLSVKKKKKINEMLCFGPGAVA